MFPQRISGICYAHEHVLGKPPDPNEDEDFFLTSESAAIQELGYFHQAGGQALVEMSPSDYGRKPDGLRRVSKATGVHIICVTGHHKEKFSGRWAAEASVEDMAAEFTRDVQIGIGDTGVKAGLIKSASSLNQITSGERKVFLAAALAHLETGAAITTHTEAGTMALEQVELLGQQGVTPNRVIVGHVDRRLEWDFLLALAQTGVYMIFDQISKEKYYPDRLRVELIIRLVEAGYGEQLLLSGDMARRSYWPSYGVGGGPGLTYILWRFVPWLKQEGLPQAAIDDLLIHNPARALAFG